MSLMRPSPRQRRLESDLRALERLRAESSLFDFAGASSEPGGAIDTYVANFRGPSFYRTPDRFEIGIGREHEVMIRLGAAYPRQAPSLAWRTAIFHPNISTSGAVCLGGYSTSWAPSLHLDQLCEMLWDMIRLHNFDVKSPYNREAAQWLAAQQGLKLPLDDRPLRDRLMAGGATLPAPERADARLAEACDPFAVPAPLTTAAAKTGEARPSQLAGGTGRADSPPAGAPTASGQRVNHEPEIIDAEIVIVAQPEILFIE